MILLLLFSTSLTKVYRKPRQIQRKASHDECKDAIKQRKQALSMFCRYPTKENLNNVKNFRAKARRTTKASKRKSWKSYVSNLNHKTPIKKVTLTSRLGLDDMSLAWPAVVQLLVFIYSGIQ